MARPFGGTLVMLLVLVGFALAVEGTVVSFDKETAKVVVKIGDKERTIEVKGTVHVHDVDGKEVKAKDLPAKLKKDVKVDVVERDGKVSEINLKK